MFQRDLENAWKELLLYLRLGKDPRAPGATTLIRKLILATLTNPAIRKIANDYRISPGELTTAYSEILKSLPDPSLVDDQGRHAVTALFSDPAEFEPFLKDIFSATHGQTVRRRQLAIVDCAHRAADILAHSAGIASAPRTRTDTLKTQIQSNLVFILVIAAILILVLLVILSSI